MASELETLTAIESSGHLNPVQRTRLEELRGQQGPDGTEGLDMSQVPSVQDYISGQFASEDPWLEALFTRMGDRQDPLDIYSELEAEAGLPELRASANTLTGEINNLEDTLRLVEGDVTARTRESMLTEAQRRGLVTEKRRPIIDQLKELGTGLGRVMAGIGRAESNIGTKTQLAMQGQQMELEPLQLMYSTMVDRNARLLTGFTEDRQTQLDMLWDKLERTRYLSDREWDLANKIAAEERSYQHEIRKIAAEYGVQDYEGQSNTDLLSSIGFNVLTAQANEAWEGYGA